MKQDLKYVSLGEVAEFYRGLTYGKNDESESSDVCVLRSNNIDLENMTLNFTELKCLKSDFVIPDDKKLKKNSIFICMSNGSKQHVGKVAYIDKDYDYAFGGFMGLIVPKNINSKFTYYICRSSYFRNYLSTIGNGIGITNLKFSDLDNFQVPFPSIDDQINIVSELDLLSSVIEKQKSQLTELDNLSQSIFYDMFGDDKVLEEKWEVKPLGEIGTFQRGGGFLKKDYVEEGVPCIHYGQIHMVFGESTNSHLNCISEETAKKSKFASKGDVIFAITSEDVEGSCKSTAWMGDYDVAVGGHTAIFKHSQNPIYISFYSKSKRFSQAKAKYAHGFKVVEMKPSELALIEIPLPPLTLQQEFAEKIEAIEAMKEKIRHSLVETQQLFNSRMDYYFS